MGKQIILEAFIDRLDKIRREKHYTKDEHWFSFETIKTEAELMANDCESVSELKKKLKSSHLRLVGI